jgi:hypothetical protein
MKDAAVIEGNLVDAKNIGTHKSFRLVIDIPQEQAMAAIHAFGWPTMTEPVRVAIARLNREVIKGEVGLERPKGGKLAQRAGIVCGEEAFETFIKSRWPRIFEFDPVNSDSAAFVRLYCNVSSRRDLDHNPEAAAKFKKLLDDYEIWLRHPELVG